MEGLIVIVLLLLGAPVILSIVALVIAASARTEVRQLRGMMAAGGEGAAAPSKPPVARPAEAAPPVKEQASKDVRPEPLAEKTQQAASQAVKPASPPPAPPPTPPSVPGASKKLEVALGGKVASFIGIAALVMGVAFFVGYAIQHGWIGPGMRIVLGLAAGGLLVVVGHVAEIKGKNLKILARSLTGGGAALFYFSVFAAYGIYALIGPVWAGVGLVLSAAAVLALSLVYASQVVAVLGVLGAFITPLLIGGAFDRGLFPLVFIAMINIPVIGLGLKRNWQILYNLAFVFTLVFTVTWLERELPGLADRAWLWGLVFSMVYFIEFISLALLKLRGERNVTGRFVDLGRLLISSMALLGAIYWILQEAGLEEWVGGAFLAAALFHVLLTKVCWQWLPAYKDETLALLVGALTFATLALPAQLDGVWVSVGWSIEGAVLAWYALRVGSVPLQAGAVGLGLFGLMKSMFYDPALYQTAPDLFLNGRFAVGFISAVLLGVQGRMHAVREKPPEEGAGIRMSWGQALGCVAIVAALGVVGVDAFISMSTHNPMPWLLTTTAVLLAGVMVTLVAAPRSPMYYLGLVLLMAVSVKILLLDIMGGWSHYDRNYREFMNIVFWSQLTLLAMAFAWMGYISNRQDIRLFGAIRTASLLNVISVLAVIVIVTLEIYRWNSDWHDSVVTIWWAACALTLALLGFMRQRVYLRYMALILFGATIIKVFLIDLADLSGLHRVVAFMGLGLLLLVLSFAYQRVAPLLLGEEKKEPEHED